MDFFSRGNKYTLSAVYRIGHDGGGIWIDQGHNDAFFP